MNVFQLLPQKGERENERVSFFSVLPLHYRPVNGPARIRTWTSRSIYDERDSITSLKISAMSIALLASLIPGLLSAADDWRGLTSDISDLKESQEKNRMSPLLGDEYAKSTLNTIREKVRIGMTTGAGILQ